MARRDTDFQTLRSEGGLLPPDLLRRVLDPHSKLPGMRPEDYGLPAGERLNEVITQSWNRLRRHWAEFRSAAARLPEGEAGTGLTNDRWNLPLLRELGFGTLPATAGPEIGGRLYAINRFMGPVPIHLIGCGLSLDRRAAGQRGAATLNPHGLLQEFLNRSDAHLWAVLSNGSKLRILRDNRALSRQSFLEFDLEAMFDGEIYSDFVLLWLVAHATRFTPLHEGRPESCWLEQWAQEAEEQGTRALGELRGSVMQALEMLGQGFVSHPRNTGLREALRSGRLAASELHAQLLRVVYRLIFLFVAEDRTVEGQSLLHPRDDSVQARRARDRYATHYSGARMRDLAARIKGSRHGDLWKQFGVVVRALSGADECAVMRAELALPALGSFLWDPASTADLSSAELANFDLLEALRRLAYTRQGRTLRPVDYRNLGAEELGGVYEGLLALTPRVGSDGATFGFVELSGNERKTSGSYYTPDALVQCLLDAALDPVVDQAIAGKPAEVAERAILDIKVCDPAVGSGHFLVGAAHRLARHLARTRALAQGESEPSPLQYQHALRDVIGRCLYGVDMNPMAAELCRVSLWLEALEPGKPLSFLDHHIRVGNSLLGTTPELIAGGLPDETFDAVKGDDKRVCSALKRRNRLEREGQMDLGLLAAAEPSVEYLGLASMGRLVHDAPDDSIAAARRKAEQFRRMVVSPEYRHRQQVADAWCTAFVWQKSADTVEAAITTDAIRRLENDVEALTGVQRAEVERHSAHYQFFHWPLAFPEVSAQGGFDCILGNPPWDTLSPDRREYFGKHQPGMRSLAPEEQDAVIDRLLESPAVTADWESHQRDLFALVHFLKNSGRYTLYAPGNLGKGDFNIYRMFTELALKQTREQGFAAQVLPGGIYGGANASAIRQFMFNHCELRNIWGLINTTRGWFAHVDIDRFAAYAARIGGITQTFLANFGLTQPADLVRGGVRLAAEFIRSSAPDTYAIPDVRSLADLTVAKKMLDAHPAFGEPIEGTPRRHYQAELHMGNDRHRFTTDPLGLPVYEGRMIDQFDHRAKTYESGHGNSARWIERAFGDPVKAITPQWRVLPEQVPTKLGDRCERYRIGFGDVANPRNERSLVATLVPPGSICGHTVPTIVFDEPFAWAYLPWLAVANSFVMDWFARRKLSSPHMTYSVMDSLPLPRPALDQSWVMEVGPLVLRLICTAPEMTAYWNRMAGLGFCSSVPDGTVPPDALLDESSRELARAELDALVALDVYGLTREELADVLDTFPVVRRRDEAAYGEFRTKRLILEIFDAMSAAKAAGETYLSRLHSIPRQDGDAAREYTLANLAAEFPASPFVLRTSFTSESTRYRVVPVGTDRVTANEQVVIACHGLEARGGPVGAAIGRIRIDQRANAATGEAFVHVTITGAAGIAQCRMSPDEWQRLRSIGIVEEIS